MKQEKSITLSIEISENLITNTLESAKSTYWADVIEYDISGMLLGKENAIIIDESGGDGGAIETHVVTRAMIIDALGILAKKYPKHFADILAENGDMHTGDLLIQVAIFGEEKYC